MDTKKLSIGLEVLAAVGVIAGLLLVGFQLKQNTELLKTQLLFEESRRAVELETLVVGENAADVWAKAMEEPEALSLAEHRQMEALLWSYAEQIRSTRMLAELGLLDDAEWRMRVDGEAGYYFGSRFGRAWWQNYSDSNHVLQADLVAAVDKRLDEVARNYTVDYMRRMYESLGGQGESSDETSR